MSKHGEFIPFVLLCIAMIMIGVAGMLICKKINTMEETVNELEKTNKVLIQQNEALQEEIVGISSAYSSYASETDAKIKLLADDLQDLKLEKEVEEKELHQKAEPEITSVGTYQLTAYIATGNPCADGVNPQVGYTAACNDPKLWHRWVHIDGYGDYYIHDRGGMASNVIDLFVGSYSEAIQFGRRSAEVSIIEK